MSENEAATILVEVRALREDIAEVRTLAAATNGRVRTLELWRARVQGAYAAGFAVIGLIAGALAQHFLG